MFDRRNDALYYPWLCSSLCKSLLTCVALDLVDNLGLHQIKSSV